jgi:mannosyl-3-phosphoglycerate phosphatase
MVGGVPVVVFSDADRVLREPAADALACARVLLAHLDRERVGLVLCSNKTRAELELLHDELGLQQPFVAEGGAAAFIPAGYFGVRPPEAQARSGYDVLEFGPPYAAVVRTLHTTAARLGVAIQGFSDMTVEAIAEVCALPLLRARLSTLREYVEPFTVLDAPTGGARLLRALAGAGLQVVTRDGWHYLGGTSGYTPATRALRRLYERAADRVHAIDLLDAPGIVAHPAGTASLLAPRDGTGDVAIPDATAWAEHVLHTVASLRERHMTAQQRRRPAALNIND